MEFLTIYFAHMLYNQFSRELMVDIFLCFSIGSGNLAAMGILEDRFKVNMDVSCSFLDGRFDNLCFV